MTFHRIEILVIEGKSTIFLDGIKTVTINGPVPHEWFLQHLIYHGRGELFCRDQVSAKPVIEREVKHTLDEIMELL